MLEFYEALPDEQFLEAQPVQVPLAACELPGPPVEIVTCQRCGEDVTDSRHVVVDGQVLCRTCAGQGYYTAPEGAAL